MGGARGAYSIYTFLTNVYRGLSLAGHEYITSTLLVASLHPPLVFLSYYLYSWFSLEHVPTYTELNI